MDLGNTDRIYKTIDASIGHNKFMRILSKIDKDEGVTMEFYNYYKGDIDKGDGTIKNKGNRYIAELVSIDKFDEVINKFPDLYPEFKIIGVTDHSNMTLEEAVETIKDLGYGKIIDYDN